RSRARGASRWGADMWLHVSAGLGTSPYAPARFACPPEADLLTMVPRGSRPFGTPNPARRQAASHGRTTNDRPAGEPDADVGVRRSSAACLVRDAKPGPPSSRQQRPLD